MHGLTFDSPARLWLLVLVAALLAVYVVLQRRRTTYAVRLPGLDLLASVAPASRWRRHLPAALLLLALTGTTAAFAEPTAQVQVPRERATVVVALDVSYSMSATDVTPWGYHSVVSLSPSLKQMLRRIDTPDSTASGLHAPPVVTAGPSAGSRRRFRSPMICVTVALTMGMSSARSSRAVP